MISNVNDIIRNKIYNCNHLDFVYYFDSLNREGKENLLKLILLDFYKISFQLKKERSNLFDQDIDNIIFTSLDDMHLVLNFLDCARVFNSMDFISKAILFENLEKYDDELVAINTSHILDKLTYQVVDDLDRYKEYYLESLNKSKNETRNTNLIVGYITSRVMLLRYEDKNKYERFILEMMKVYYKWKNFIKEHEGEYLLNDEDFIYLQQIKNKSIEVLLDDIENDFNFMAVLVSEYLHYTTSKLEIKEEIVDKYLSDSSSDELKKKLKIKCKDK